MQHLRRWIRSVVVVALCSTSSVGVIASAAAVLPPANSPAAAPPLDRVRGPVTSERVRLKGQTHPMARTGVDLGEVSSSISTGRMVLWLRRSAEQQAQLSQFLSESQNPKSAGYRHWMTPESYGTTYGISDHDLAAVQQWLQANGLKVEHVSSARNAILFSGVIGSLKSAFHTSIHTYSVGNKTHVSNVSDPEIPAALAPVIAGLSPMNDIRATPMHVLNRPGRYDAASGRLKPALTIDEPNGEYGLYVTPADAAIIYDTPNQTFNPATTQTLDGSGVTIGILGYSELVMADVQNYRTAFLPASAAGNLPKTILDGGTDPGVIDGGYAVEPLLDVEIAGGLVPGAGINYYYAASSDLSDGLILAGLRALEDNKVSIISASYGTCENDLGPGGNLAWAELWQQAVAQGITVTVSTGDTGSANCDGDTYTAPIQATRGLSVSGIASTPYNIAVGGTDFYPLVDNISTYVNTTTTGRFPYYGTALSYIPENPWNDSSNVVLGFPQNVAATNQIGTTDIIAGGGGLSSMAVCPGTIDDQGGCSEALTGYTEPAYQTLFQSRQVRSIPDVSLLAGNGFFGAGWVFCADSASEGDGSGSVDCQVDSSGHLIDDQNVGGIGGTSAAAPAFAAMLAMVSQSQGGARLGQANAVLYNLAQDYNPTPGNLGKYQRAFHDITVGNNSVYCVTGSQDCNPDNNFLEGYDANPSYDMATGLGSIDASQLVSLWSAANFTSTGNTLAAGTSASTMSTAPISVVHGTPLYFGTTVSPSDATGQFSILVTNSTTAASSSDFGTLVGSGSGSLTTNDLPGGTYSVYAYYAGDTSHTGSQSSNSINVAITAEPSATLLTFGAYDPTTGVTSEGVNTLPYGSGTFISAQPLGNNSKPDANGNIVPDGVPTGSVTFTSKGTTQSVALDSLGVAQISASSFAPGIYTYQASYPGDSSFAPSTSSMQTLTITKAPTTLTLVSDATIVGPNWLVDLTATLQTDSIGLVPSGNVSAAVNGHVYPPTQGKESQTNGVSAITFSFLIPASDLASGFNTIGVLYGGDTNYRPSGANVSVALSGVSGSYSLNGAGQPVSVEASQEGSTAIRVVPSNGFTGVVGMTCTVSAATTGHTPICQAPPVQVYGTSAVSSVVSIATYADTPVGAYTITITGTSSQLTEIAQIPLQVTPGPGFALAAATNPLSIATPGQATTDALSIVPTQAFPMNVTLGCTVTPAPLTGKAPTCSLPGSVVLGSSTATSMLQVTTDSTTPPGTYNIAVTAVSGVIQQGLTIPLTIPGTPVASTFGLAASQAALSIATAGQSATDPLTITPAGGFTGTVQLSCTVSGTSSYIPTCTVPATASVTGSSAVNAMLTVNTTGSSTALDRGEERLLGQRLGGIALGCLLMFAIPRRRLRAGLVLLLLTAGIVGISGCSGGGQSGTTPPASSGSGSSGGPTSTPSGSYTVTVKAVSGSTNTTTQVTVTVQ